jgi:hypothetical protein
MKLTMLVELEYDESIMHGEDAEAIEAFNGMLMRPTEDIESALILHSNYIGEEVGTIRVIRFGVSE